MKTLFLTSIAGDVLDDIVKYLPKNPKELNLAFIITASEVYTGDLWWLKKDKDKLIELGFNIIEFTITGLTKSKIEEKLKDIDIIFVVGGNQLYLLDQAIKTGFDQILLQKYQNNNLIYIGSSAGSMILGKNIDISCTKEEKSLVPDLKSNGINLIGITIVPHFGNPKYKQFYSQFFEKFYNTDTKLTFLRDNQYLYIKDDTQKLIQV
jgi:dipeptidase E